MSDQAVPPDDAPVSRPPDPQETLAVEEIWTAPDPSLRSIVDLVNAADIQISIRLFMPGMIMSGLLVSAAHFFDTVAGSLTESNEDPVSSALADVYRRNAEKLREAGVQEKFGEADVIHVHLSEAMLYAPGQPPLEVGSWRGRLGLVMGWSLGAYSVKS